MNKYNFIYLLTVAYISLVKGDLKLTIAHDNDIHARFPPVTVHSSLCIPWKERCMAGVARLMHVYEEIKKNRTNKVLHLSAGDFYQGSIWFNEFKSEIVNDYVFKMAYDVVTLGNHEFDDGVDGLLPYLLEAKKNSVPIVCTNLNITGEPKLQGLIEKSIIQTYDGYDVAYIGYVLPSTAYLSKPGPTIIFNDEIQTLKSEVEKLKRRGINKIIALGHSGYQRDLEIAKAIPDIDIIVGGHSNTFLWPGTINKNASPPSIEEPVAPYPTIVSQPSNRKTFIVQAYAFSKYLGLLDVTFDDHGDIIDFSGQPLLMSEDISQETTTNISDLTEQYFKRASHLFTTVGHTAVLLEGREVECRFQECLLGNLIADAYVHSFLNERVDPSAWTKYPIALVPGGGIRTSIDVLARQGEIMKADILNACPFSNDLVAVDVTGEQLYQVFEHSVSAWTADMHQLEGRYLQTSGIKVVYDCTKSPGQRVKSLKARCGNCTSPDYYDVKAESNYTILVTSYMKSGGDGYLMLRNNTIVAGAPAVNDTGSLVTYLAHHRIALAEIQGRTMFDPSILSMRSHALKIKFSFTYLLVVLFVSVQTTCFMLK